MSHAVEIENVTKSFGSFIAVNDLSLQIPANTVYGFIGPNGSGKTTTLRMIMRIYLPDRGRVSVLGDESWHAASDRVERTRSRVFCGEGLRRRVQSVVNRDTGDDQDNGPDHDLDDQPAALLL